MKIKQLSMEELLKRERYNNKFGIMWFTFFLFTLFFTLTFKYYKPSYINIFGIMLSIVIFTNLLICILTKVQYNLMIFIKAGGKQNGKRKERFSIKDRRKKEARARNSSR